MNTVSPNLIDVAVIYALQQELREIRGMITHLKPVQDQKSVLNMSEAAAFTGISKSHLYKLTSTGGIPCYKRGKHLHFKREELEQWLLSNRKATAEEIDATATNYVVLHKGGAK